MNKNTLSEEKKLELYEKLSKRFSLLPVNGKEAFDTNWTQWCETKREFNRKDFVGRNAGIAAGPASGVLILDIDNWHLFESFRHRYGYPELTKTMVVRSGGSTPEKPKCHYYFQYPDDDSGETYKKRVFPVLGFDLLGTGSQAIAPGSTHPDTGNVYEVIDKSPIADPPDWLLSLYQKHPKEWTRIYPDKLRVPDEITNLIMEGKPEGERSEAMMSVINSMVGAGYSDDHIFYVFYSCPIGEKHMGRGSTRDKCLQDEIDKARNYVQQGSASVDIVVKEPEFSLDIVWGDEFVAREYEIIPMIDGMLEEKGSLLLIGPTGIGKSIFTLNIAMAIGSAQKSLWDRFAIQRPLRTAIVQAENPAPFVWQRMRMIAGGDESLSAGLNRVALPVVNERFRTLGFKFMEKKFRELVLRIKDKTMADILIVDPLISYAGVDENNNSEMRNTLDALTDVCMQAELSLIMIHHSGKVGDQGVHTGRGASSLSDWASNVVVLTNEVNSGQQTIKVKSEKTRVGPRFETFHLEKDGNLVLREFNPLDRFDYGKIVSMFNDNGGSFDNKSKLTKSICEKFEVGNNKARYIIEESESRGIIISKTGERNKKIFSLRSAL
jgi:DNA polymerase III delta prime subunit